MAENTEPKEISTVLESSSAEAPRLISGDVNGTTIRPMSAGSTTPGSMRYDMLRRMYADHPDDAIRALYK